MSLPTIFGYALSAEIIGLQEFNHRFLRIHRNALVAQDMLHSLTKNPEGHACISFTDIDDLLEVSRRHLPDIRKKMRARSG